MKLKRMKWNWNEIGKKMKLNWNEIEKNEMEINEIKWNEN